MLIVNRGEIASRAIFAGKSLGIQTILFCTPADQDTLAFREAEEVYLCNSSEAGESYNSLDEILKALKESRADSLYAGYGFLSEKAELADLCEKQKVKFIGPSAHALTSLAHKGGARELAKACGLGTLEINAPFKDEQYPILMKVAHGGGGRGHSLVQKPEDFQLAMENLLSKSSRLFQSTEIIYERFLSNAKHVELQIFTDNKGKTHFLGTRDCSFQRNFQKLIEEGPADPKVWSILQPHFPAINDYLLSKKYEGPGTLEFLYLSKTNEIFFLEINCRIQVEHTVTEELCGVDLVYSQIANALKPSYVFSFGESRGHVIELRLYAEDPAQGFVPSTGKIHFLQIPHLPSCRFDMTFGEGQSISAHYDPLIGKVIIRDQTRENCINRLKLALEKLVIMGVQTSQSYLLEVLGHPDFVNQKHSVQWLPAFADKAYEHEAKLKEKILQNYSNGTQIQMAKMENLWKISHRF